MTFEAADMAATETWYEHSIHDFSADDAGKFGREWLPGFTVRAPVKRGLFAATFGRSVDGYRRRREDGCVLCMSAIGAMTLEVNAVDGRGSVACCRIWERAYLGTVTVPVLTRTHVLRVIGHCANLKNLAPLHGKIPHQQQVRI